jgi:antitoxin YefM
MTSMTATEARRRLYALLEIVASSHDPIQIAGKRHSAVLVSEDYWRAVQESLHLLSIPGMRASIRRGLKMPVEECYAELGW